MRISITDDQLHALADLRRKRCGETVRFVNIADARVLTAQGLAVRTREGWAITPEGETFLTSLQAAGALGGDGPERPRLRLC